VFSLLFRFSCIPGLRGARLLLMSRCGASVDRVIMHTVWSIVDIVMFYFLIVDDTKKGNEA